MLLQNFKQIFLATTMFGNVIMNVVIVIHLHCYPSVIIDVFTEMKIRDRGGELK